MSRGAGRRGRVRVLAAVLAAVLVLPGWAGAQEPAPADGGQDRVPDRVEEPAPGEAAPPEDPSEPSGAMTYAAQPSARVRLGAGTGFPQQQVDQLSGPNRFATAVATSRAGWPGTAPAAVLASGEDFADALAASVLAGTVGGPLLLTPIGRLDADTLAELQRLQPGVVYVVGGVSAAVEAELAAASLATERVGDGDRYATPMAIARRAVQLGADASTVLVASGERFPDALSASVLAAGARHPILLTTASGGRERLQAQVAELGAQRTWVVGGTAVLPDEAVAGLPGVERLAGRDRAGTAAAVASRALALGFAGRPVVVGGDNFPDGLSGGVFAGAARRAPLLVTASKDLSVDTAAWLAGTGNAAVTVVGGRAALSGVVVCQLHVGTTRSFLCAEEELARQGYNVGRVDGGSDHQTVWALYAFAKVAGLPVTGEFAEREWQAMLRHPRMAVRRPDLPPDHMEIDLARQLVLVVRGGEVRHVLHTSTGKPSTPTVRGTFTVYEKRNYRQTHNRMYRPVFFYRGYAFHGYPEIPLYPASAGCARLYDGDMDLLFPLLKIGERVASY